MSGQPALIALDWGTSSLRGFLLGAGGRVLAQRHSDAGVQRLASEGAPAFARAFDALVQEWRTSHPALPVVACGMVGSAQGWREVAYVPCPADAQAIAAAAGDIEHAGASILVAPGVMHDPANGRAPDVMRGEETQVIGVLQSDPRWAARACLVLPGTHSKWVTVHDGGIVALRTAMTGEVFALLRAHSILGRLMSDAPAAEPGAAFARGLDDAQREPDLLHALFAVRTLGLTKRLPPDQGADYLSGLLIGSELRGALASVERDTPILLVGEDALCRRYALAFAHLGRPAAAPLGNTAPAGLWALARARGLVG